MKLPRLWLRRISRLLLLCVAFQNIAIAAHECRIEAAPAAAVAMRHCIDGQHEASQPLPDSTLCAEHCKAERATSASTIDPPVFLALPSLQVPVALATSETLRQSALTLRPLAPERPIRTRYCSLLI